MDLTQVLEATASPGELIVSAPAVITTQRCDYRDGGIDPGTAASGGSSKEELGRFETSIPLPSLLASLPLPHPALLGVCKTTFLYPNYPSYTPALHLHIVSIYYMYLYAVVSSTSLPPLFVLSSLTV